MRFLKQSTSVVVQFGPFVDAGDGVTLEVGLATAMDNATTGIRLSKNGAVFADRGDATVPAYDAMGCYRVTLSAADTGTLGTLRMIFEEAATCLPHWDDFMIMPANVWDSMFGADALDVNVAQWLGTAAATPTTAGVPEVDVTFISGTAQTANDNGADINTLITQVGTAGDGLTNIGTIATVTTLTNLPSIPANWLTAAGIAAGALDGKGNWNIGKTGYSLTAVTGLGNQTANITGTVSTVTDVTNLHASAATSAGQITVDQIWDEPLAGHGTADTAGLLLNEWQDGGRLDLILDSRMAEASINTTGGAVDSVTLVTTTTTNTDMLLATAIVSAGAITTSGGIASADTKKINGATVVGDGNGTPWDGA